jgi:hypothetical protein
MRSFSVHLFISRKGIGVKAALKMLVKLASEIGIPCHSVRNELLVILYLDLILLHYLNIKHQFFKAFIGLICHIK